MLQLALPPPVRPVKNTSKQTFHKMIDSLPNELYSAILGYLTEHDQASMLCLNSAYFDLTVRITWSTVDGLYRLLRLLPHSVSDMLPDLDPDDGPSISDDSSDVTFLGEAGAKYVRFQTEELPQYESRYWIYASKVTTLNICDPTDGKYIFLDLEPIVHMHPLTPHLTQINFKSRISVVNPPIEQAVTNVIFLFAGPGLRSLSITTPADTPPLVTHRYQLAQILDNLERSVPSLEKLSLDLDLRHAVAPTATLRPVLFQGLRNLTELSCQAPILRSGWAPIGDLGLLPNLFRLELWEWGTVPGVGHVGVNEGGNMLFPELREVVFSRIHPDQAAYLLSSVFPNQLRSVKFVFLGCEPPPNQLIEVTTSLLRHWAHLSVLKIALDNPTSVQVLPVKCRDDLSQLSYLESLEVKHYCIPELVGNISHGSWPALRKLYLPDHRFQSVDLTVLARTRPLLQELAMTIGTWHYSDILPAGQPVRRSDYPLAYQPMLIISSFRIGNYETDRVEGMASQLQILGIKLD
ncbi:hypothetical protein FRC11_000930 [Ceratobasidium sp. 423]|nr:hypothetical protein FRC11_000930 [Ceratobasidium sp. 423]